MKKIKPLRIARSLLLLSLFCILFTEEIAQENPYASIPEHLRERFIERLKLMIDYQKNQQWSSLYDLLASHLTNRISKEDYVKKQQRLAEENLGIDLVDFKIESVRYVTGAPYDVFIRGCGKFRLGRKIEKLESMIEAYWERGDWYFTIVSPFVEIDGNAPRCSFETKQKSKK